MKIEKLKELKTAHELPNDNTYEYNYGYVKAINDVLNMIQRDEQELQEFYDNTAEAIDAGGGCSRCGDVSGFECICEDEDEFELYDDEDTSGLAYSH